MSFRYLRLTVVLLILGIAFSLAFAAPESGAEAFQKFRELVWAGRDSEAINMLDGALTVNRKAKCNVMPLHEAIFAQRQKVVEVLIRKGANVNAVRCKGWTPLLDASASVNSSASITTLLIKNGARINSKRFDGQTAIHLAANQCNLSVLLVLLDAGANPNIRDAQGQTPLFLVHDASAAKLLIDYGADIGIRDKLGRSPYDVVRAWEVEKLGEGPLNESASEYLLSASSNEGAE